MIRHISEPLFDALLFGDRLFHVMKQNSLSVRDAGRQIGISHSTVARITLGGTPDIESYLRVVKWLEGKENENPHI
jgi:transcriptional regulator with XRE-family HTH domain